VIAMMGFMKIKHWIIEIVLHVKINVKSAIYKLLINNNVWSVKIILIENKTKIVIVMMGFMKIKQRINEIVLLVKNKCQTCDY
jgi:hypothetical protein